MTVMEAIDARHSVRACPEKPAEPEIRQEPDRGISERSWESGPVFFRRYDSPLGRITLASDGAALTGLWFEGQRYFPSVPEQPYTESSLPVFDEAGRWLDCYFSGTAPDFTPKLALRGTAFRLAVWEILLTVPYGKTVTYGWVAACAAEKQGLARMSPRAVGGAVGRNPISLIVPCHRVVCAGGLPGGYAGGTERKIRLLEMEQARPVRYPPR